MTDRNFVLRWAHLGLGRNPRHRQIIEEERRAFEAHVAKIQAEQEQKNAALAARKTSHLPVVAGDRQGDPAGSGACLRPGHRRRGPLLRRAGVGERHERAEHPLRADHQNLAGHQYNTDARNAPRGS